jgi:hypothetical protein
MEVIVPIENRWRSFPTRKRYVTLPDGTKHGRFVKEGPNPWNLAETLLYEERFYENGKRHGKCSIWMMHQGQVYDYLQINNYRDGKLHGEQVYYESHSWTPKRWEHYNNGVLVGVFIKEKYNSGYKANYALLDGKWVKHGRCRTYYVTHHIDTSSLKTDGEWYYGRRVGVHREYAQGIKYRQPGPLVKEVYHVGDDDNLDGKGYEPNRYEHIKKYKVYQESNPIG